MYSTIQIWREILDPNDLDSINRAACKAQGALSLARDLGYRKIAENLKSFHNEMTQLFDEKIQEREEQKMLKTPAFCRAPLECKSPRLMGQIIDQWPNQHGHRDQFIYFLEGGQAALCGNAEVDDVQTLIDMVHYLSQT